MASEREPHPVGAGLGFGVRTLGDINTVSLDVSALAVADDEGERGRGRHHRATDTDDGSVNALLRSRLTYNCQFLSHFGIITGLSYNVLLVSDRTQNDRLLLPMGSYQYDPTPEVRLWPGAFIGLRF
jgi:hypothetical protein